LSKNRSISEIVNRGRNRERKEDNYVGFGGLLNIKRMNATTLR
jgi:hypothetical protein